MNGKTRLALKQPIRPARLWLVGIIGCLSLFYSAAAKAQVAGDGSTGTLVNGKETAPCNGSCTITGGTEAQNNLFHSLSQFSLPSGSEAIFNVSSEVQNIITRVTGGDISNLDGLISATGSVNLFLLNPAGVIFGANAALDLGGSFITSTAESLIFDNGAEFKTTDTSFPQALLTVNTPIGLQYGNNPQPISVAGQGNNLAFNPDNFEVIRDFRPLGLQVKPGQTLALVGGDVTLLGGNITAPQGKIEVGSVGSDSFVSLTNNSGWSLGYEGVSNFGAIALSQAASIDTSGDGGGTIQIRGDRLSLTEGSAILSYTLGDVAGENINIKANALEVGGVSANAPFVSSIFADTASSASGRGGNVVLEVGELQILNGGQIGASTFGTAQAGNLAVQAGQITVDGGSPFGPSGLFAIVAPGASGQGGEINIEADRLQILNGGQISVSSFGFGQTGNLTVAAQNITISGVFEIPEAPLGESPSSLLASMEVFSQGKGGNISVTGDRLRIDGGGQIFSSTFGEGDAGSLLMQVDNIELVGGSQNLASGIFSTVAILDATGNGGDINIETTSLQISQGAQLVTSTLGLGNAGDLLVRASETVTLTGTAENGRSGLFANALVGNGSGGNVTVITDLLTISDGAIISVSNFPSASNSPFPPGQGAAGNINLIGRNIVLDGEATITADTLAGDLGNIEMTTDLLLMRQASRISTDAQGEATGGNININAADGFIIAPATENSDITANAVFGAGGRITINAANIFGIEPRQSLTSLSDITASSEFGIAGEVRINAENLEPDRGLDELDDNVAIPELVQGCQTGATNNDSSFINVGRGGLRTQSEEMLGSNELVGDIRLPQQWSENASKTDTYRPPARIVEAQGWMKDEQGNVFLVAQMPSLIACR